MKIPEIKRLMETYTKNDLFLAEEAILNESRPQIEINGDDQGEQLTHVIAAIWCINAMEKSNLSVKDALREYTIKVRTSIN